eukprot:Clim_evm113s147 gene=Clim_evmTU113s147
MEQTVEFLEQLDNQSSDVRKLEKTLSSELFSTVAKLYMRLLLNSQDRAQQESWDSKEAFMYEAENVHAAEVATEAILATVFLREKDIILERGNGGYGFNIIGGANIGTPAHVYKITPKGPADLEGNLRSGDHILAINDVECDSLNHADVIELIKESDDELRLRVKHDPISMKRTEDFLKRQKAASINASK